MSRPRRVFRSRRQAQASADFLTRYGKHLKGRYRFVVEASSIGYVVRGVPLDDRPPAG